MKFFLLQRHHSIWSLTLMGCCNTACTQLPVRLLDSCIYIHSGSLCQNFVKKPRGFSGKVPYPPPHPLLSFKPDCLALLVWSGGVLPKSLRSSTSCVSGYWQRIRLGHSSTDRHFFYFNVKPCTCVYLFLFVCVFGG